MQFGITCIEFFSEDSYSFRCFQSDGSSSFHVIGAATEKTGLPKLSLVLGTISCEIDDLSCLWIFERCRRLANFKLEIGFEWGTSRISIRTYIILNLYQ